MKINTLEVSGIIPALHGMRNPMNSWAKSDTTIAFHAAENFTSDDPMAEKYREWNDKYGFNVKIGPNDKDLASRLIKAGPEHCKFLRQISVVADVTAPLYWWKEMDTYKIGTTANSTSTMHKIASAPITRENFEMDDYEGRLLMYEREPYDLDAFTDDMWDNIINYCETLRQTYLETNDARYWKELIRLLPESWLQTRTWSCNYEVLRNIYRQRKNHKLSEWHTFCDWIETLPYADLLILGNS